MGLMISNNNGSTFVGKPYFCTCHRLITVKDLFLENKEPFPHTNSDS